MAPPQFDGIRTQAFTHCSIQQHLQLAPVHRALWPLVACQQAARLAVDVAAIAADQRPFFGLNANGVERGRVKAQVVKFAHGIGLQVDAHAQGLQVFDGLVNYAVHADLMKRECQRHTANATASDQDRGIDIDFLHGGNCLRFGTADYQ